MLQHESAADILGFLDIRTLLLLPQINVASHAAWLQSEGILVPRIWRQQATLGGLSVTARSDEVFCDLLADEWRFICQCILRFDVAIHECLLPMPVRSTEVASGSVAHVEDAGSVIDLCDGCRACLSCLCFDSWQELRCAARCWREIISTTPKGAELFLLTLPVKIASDDVDADVVGIRTRSGRKYNVELEWDEEECCSMLQVNALIECPTQILHRPNWPSGRCAKAGVFHGNYEVTTFECFCMLPTTKFQNGCKQLVGEWASCGVERQGFGPNFHHPTLDVDIAGSGFCSQVVEMVEDWLGYAQPLARENTTEVKKAVQCIMAIVEEETGFLGHPSCRSCQEHKINIIQTLSGKTRLAK